MMRFRKKPVVIEAVRWDGRNLNEVNDFLKSQKASFTSEGTVIIHTLEGKMAANPGDWIIKGVKDEFYPCKPDIFEATYERVLRTDRI